MKFRLPTKPERRTMIKEHLRIMKMLGDVGNHKQREDVLQWMLKQYVKDFGVDYYGDGK